MLDPNPIMLLIRSKT